MKIEYIACLVVCVLSLGTVAYAGEIYKWVDEHGNVNYSQDPQHKSAKQMSIKIQKSSSSEQDAPTSENTSTGNPQTPEDNADKDESEKQAAAQKQQEEAKKKNCQIAMKRLATISTGGRLYEVDEKGERHYWDDQTRQAKMTDAQKDVDQWCGQE